MGYNTTVILLNDHLSEIEDHPEYFARRLLEAIHRNWTTGQKEDFTCGLVITQDHADTVAIIAVGGNYGTVLRKFDLYKEPHHHPEDRKKLIRQLVEEEELGEIVKRTRIFDPCLMKNHKECIGVTTKLFRDKRLIVCACKCH